MRRDQAAWRHGPPWRVLRVPVWLALALLSVTAPAATMESEVPQLLARMEASGCEFYRNGSWASGATARAHLERKYRAMRERHLVATTEEFIERGATRSSMTGEAYRVRCAGAETGSAAWFTQELRRMRAARGEAT